MTNPNPERPATPAPEQAQQPKTEQPESVSLQRDQWENIIAEKALLTNEQLSSLFGEGKPDEKLNSGRVRQLLEGAGYGTCVEDVMGVANTMETAERGVWDNEALQTYAVQHGARSVEAINNSELQQLLEGDMSQKLQTFLRSEEFTDIQDSEEKTRRLARWLHEARLEQGLSIDEFEQRGGFESEEKRTAYEKWDWQMAEELLGGSNETPAKQAEAQATGIEHASEENYRFQSNMEYLSNPQDKEAFAALKKSIGAEGESEKEGLERLARYAEGKFSDNALQWIGKYIDEIALRREKRRTSKQEKEGIARTNTEIYTQLQKETGLTKEDLGIILDQQDDFLRSVVHNEYMGQKKFGIGSRSVEAIKAGGYITAGVSGLLTGGAATAGLIAATRVADRVVTGLVRDFAEERRLNNLKDRLKEQNNQATGNEDNKQAEQIQKDQQLRAQLQHNVAAAMATRIQETIDRIGGRAAADKEQVEDDRVKAYIKANENFKDLNSEQKESLAVLTGVLRDHDKENDRLQKKRGGWIAKTFNKGIDAVKRVLSGGRGGEQVATTAALITVGYGVREMTKWAGASLGLGGMYAGDLGYWLRRGRKERRVSAAELTAANAANTPAFNEMLAIAEEQLQDKKFRKSNPQEYDALRLAVDKRRQELIARNKDEFVSKGERGVEKNTEAISAYLKEYNDRTLEKITLRKSEEREKALWRAGGMALGALAPAAVLAGVDRLHEHGSVSTPSEAPVLGDDVPHSPEAPEAPEAPAHEVTLTMPTEGGEAPEAGPQFEHDHYPVERTWMDNDTPGVKEGNEKLFLFGGTERTGFDANDNVVFDVSKMTADGSFHGDATLNVPDLRENGKLVMLVTPAEGGEAVAVPVQPDGTVVIGHDSPLRSWFEENAQGQASFKGRYLEIAHVNEAGEGPRPADIIATVKGTNELNEQAVRDLITPPPAELTAPQGLSFKVSNEDLDVAPEAMDTAQVTPVAIPAGTELPESMHLAAIDVDGNGAPEGFAVVVEGDGGAVTVETWPGDDHSAAIAHAQKLAHDFSENNITNPADMRTVTELAKTTGIKVDAVADNFKRINKTIFSDTMKEALTRMLAGNEPAADALQNVDPALADAVQDVRVSRDGNIVFDYGNNVKVTVMDRQLAFNSSGEAGVPPSERYALAMSSFEPGAKGAVHSLGNMTPKEFLAALKNPAAFFNGETPAAEPRTEDWMLYGDEGAAIGNEDASIPDADNAITANSQPTAAGANIDSAVKTVEGEHAGAERVVAEKGQGRDAGSTREFQGYGIQTEQAADGTVSSQYGTQHPDGSSEFKGYGVETEVAPDVSQEITAPSFEFGHISGSERDALQQLFEDPKNTDAIKQLVTEYNDVIVNKTSEGALDIYYPNDKMHVLLQPEKMIVTNNDGDVMEEMPYRAMDQDLSSYLRDPSGQFGGDVSSSNEIDLREIQKNGEEKNNEIDLRKLQKDEGETLKPAA